MDFDGGTRVTPRVMSTGTSHARWYLLVRPLRWVALALPMAIGAWTVGSNQDDHAGFFMFSGFLATVLSVVWLAEALSVLPIVFKMRHVVKSMPIRHNPLFSVSTTVYNTSLSVPAMVRSVTVSVSQVIAFFMFFIGATTVSASEEKQLTVEAVLAFATMVYMFMFLTPVYGVVKRFVLGCSNTRTMLHRAGIRHDVRILQFNLNGGVGVDGFYKLERTAETINLCGADIVAIQEVPRKCKTTPHGVELGSARQLSDMVQLLAGMTKMHVIFCTKTVGYGGQYGNAILSRWPALQVSQLRLMGWKHHASNRLFGPVPQIALAGRFRPSGFSRDMWVVCTQFGYDFSGQEQVEEMRELVHWMRNALAPSQTRSIGSAESGTVPPESPATCCHPKSLVPTNVVVCGDFASMSSCPAMTFARQCDLRDASTLVPPNLCGPLGTYPAKTWRAAFSPDKVLLPTQSPFKVIDSSPLLSSASTHRPLLTVVGDTPSSSQ